MGRMLLLSAETWNYLSFVTDSQETVAWVFFDDFSVRKIDSFWALVFAEIIDRLLFTAAKCDLLGVQVVCDTFRVRVLVSHYELPSLMVS